MSIFKKELAAACTLLLFSLPLLLHAQLDSAAVMPLLKRHISTLASDEYGGREPGTRGEELAHNYITREFSSIGIAPMGSKGYLQPFTFTKRLSSGDGTQLVISGKTIKGDQLCYPLPWSADNTVKALTVEVGFGISAPALGYDDYAGKKDLKGRIFIIDASTPDKGGPHSKYAEMADLRTRIDTAIRYGAAGIIFHTRDSELKEPSLNTGMRITPSSIPILYLTREGRTVLDQAVDSEAVLTTQIIRVEATGHNVVGFIDNKAGHTIVLGAHYDHLGMGGEESLYRGEPAVHNGADDNASGVAGLIELARYFRKNGPKNNNYLFIAFSAEEKGLLGSGYFTRNPTLDISNMNYMLNMDMIGRLKKEDPVLIISGTGTSDAWKIAMDYMKPEGFKVKTSESGIGPSDHTSFYLKDIPVLHFFSGTHNDYHKPGDDEALINYEGQLAILNYMVKLVDKLDDKGKLAFVKTKEEKNENTPRFKVTLGVIPDYAFEGEGMRIDGVSEGKPAAKAGIKAGDVVRKIGEHNVSDMMSYMKALGKFSKGDKAVVIVQRDNAQLPLEVEF